MIGRRIGTQIVVLLLILQLSGCSMGLQTVEKQKISDDQLLPAVSDMIEQQKEVVWPYLEEEVSRSLTKSDPPSGKQIVNNTLSEGQGREYLEFCYAVGGDPQGEADVETVVSYAHTLLSDEEQQQLEQQLEVRRSLLQARGETLARGLAPPSQRAAFWKDMQKLVTRTLVLFTAGVVYACIPTTVFWGGKISAATAIAIASGVVATTVMSIWRYYQFGGTPDEAFGDWLKTVTTEPELSSAMTASVISVGKTLKRGGPVVTGIIICVFALYNVVDMIKPMLSSYDFTI